MWPELLNLALSEFGPSGTIETVLVYRHLSRLFCICI